MQYNSRLADLDGGHILKLGLSAADKVRMSDPTITSYSVRLETWLRRDGTQWLVWCPSIEVMTQARTKKKAFESLRQAVQLWFESCIERGVLDAALKEVGFEKVPADEEVLRSASPP